MQITAQKRSLLNKLREVTNVGGIISEKIMPAEFKEVMDKLRDETDDPIRAIITGEQIGEASPPEDAISLKDLLRSAESNINRREYMKATSDLGRFHKKMNDVVKILSSFNSNLDKIHEKFLFEGLDDDSKKYLQDLKSRFASSRPALVKEANILDFWTNIATERGRALSSWEKRYPKQVGKLKKDTANVLNSSKKLLATVLSVLKSLATARATRNPDKYIEEGKKILKAYDAYDKTFKNYYTENIKGFLEKQEFMAPTQVDTGPAPKEIGKQEVQPITPPGVAPIKTDPAGVLPLVTPPKTMPMEAPPTMSVLPPPPQMPAELSQTSPAPPPVHQSSPPPEQPPVSPKMTPEEMRRFEAQHGFGAVSHQSFYDSLQKMSHESPAVLSTFIVRYANSIKSSDPAVAIQLFKIASRIKS